MLSTEILCFIFSLFCATVAQVIEFVQFKDRLQRSMQYLAVKSDSVILSLKQNSESLEEVEVSYCFWNL
jgi:sensor c-di-GMP phosphodiesterase-like protein